MTCLHSSDLHILLVEPSSVQRKIIRNELLVEGVDHIDEADSVESALQRISAVKPDLVISSLHLPDGSAELLLDHIRQHSDTQDLPFMLVSSETRHAQLEKFKQSGAIAILPKPFNHKHLKTAIDATIDLLNTDELALDCYDPRELRILVVDDSKMARNLICRVLRNLDIENITEAEDGAEAISMLPQGFDLVITDFNMPEVDGLELTSYIRNSSEYGHLPVLMVTSEANQAHLSNVSKAGVNAMTDKPFEPNTVKRLLTSLLEG